MRELLTHPLMLPIVVPIAAGIVCLVMPKALEKLCSAIAVVASAATVALVWPLFRSGGGEFAYRWWLRLGLDSLNGFILLGAAGFGFLIMVYSVGYMKGKERLREYYAYSLLTIGASCGALLAGEFVLLLVFWGFLGITLYLLTGIGGPDAAAAAKKSFVIVGGSDGILVLGVAIVWVLTGSTRMDGPQIPLDRTLSYVGFLCFAIAAFAKAGAMPFHSWVPDCGEKAPASVAAFLPASVDKLLGIYLLARVTTGVFGANAIVNTFLALVGAATVILAVMMALVQHDLKRLLSYHAVSQVGYMVLGIATGTAIGLAGGLFHMLNHSMYKSCLFLCAGSIEKKTESSDLDKLGGLASNMPITFFACTVAALSISGVPPLNGFASKWMVYQGVVEMGKGGGVLWVVWLVAAMLGSALTLASFVKLLHASFLRRPVAARKVTEVGPLMWLPMVFLAAMCILFGVLAYRIPLSHMILPAAAMPVEFVGTWWSGPATAMLLIGLLVGVILYLAGTVRKARTCATYVGGEVMDQAYVSGQAPGRQRDLEVTGVDFYKTVSDMQPFKLAYALAQKKLFDLYDVVRATAFYAVHALRTAHNGALPVYLTWFLAGLLLVIIALRVGL
jgi:formate hydrogenlyase subunit 3/multisubunit Na+/H+ antiporter MnhD subunit